MSGEVPSSSTLTTSSCSGSHSTFGLSSSIGSSDLPHMLDAYRNQTAQIAEAHLNYLSMLDELKSELDTLSTEVTNVQQDCAGLSYGGASGDYAGGCGGGAGGGGGSSGVGPRRGALGASGDGDYTSDESQQLYEESLQALMSQNDLLQQALEQALKDKDGVCTQMANTNDSLKCQIENLQLTLAEKEARISQLNTMLSRGTLPRGSRSKSPSSRQQHLQKQQQYPQQQPPYPHYQSQHQSRTQYPQQQQPIASAASVCSCCGSPTTTPQQQLQLQQQDQELCDLRGQLEQARLRIESLMGDVERSQKQERQLHCDQRKLNDELLESKRKNNDLICHTRRLAALLKTQEAHRMDLSKKFETMEQNYADQSRKLRAANGQLNMLQDRFNQMDKRNEEQVMERNLLREELLALKEKEACLVGKQKSQQDQLLKTERELYKAHDVIKEQRCILQRNDNTHHDVVARLQEASEDIKRQLNAALDDYRQLERDYKKRVEVCTQNEKIIESFRRWKEAQLQADAASKHSFKQYEEHIKSLLEEKQNFIEQYRDLRRDYCILQSEVERLKLCSMSAASSSGLNTLDSTMTQRMELLRQTYLRLADKCNNLQSNDATIPSQQQPQQQPQQEAQRQSQQPVQYQQPQPNQLQQQQQ